MANVTITQLPNAGAITGTELVPIVQNGVTVHTTTSALAGSPVQTQTFLTVNNEPSLTNSRRLAVGSGLSLTDGGAQSSETINLSGAVSNFNALGTGVVVKTGTSTLAARTLATSGQGLSMTNGDGVAGDPTVQLTGIAAAIASSSGTGMLAIVGGSTIANRTLTGTVNQIGVTDGNGASNPTISLSSNPIVPGLAGITIPVGASADRSVSAGVGTLRYNTSMDVFEGYTSLGWGVIVAGAAVTTFSAGTTGLTPNTPSTGAIVMGGTLITSNGGTGLSTYTAGDLTYYASGTALTKLAIGASGYVLQSNGSAPVWVAASTVVGGAAGANTQVQYNSSGVLAASANLTFNGTILTSAGFAGPLNGTVGATTPASGSFTNITGSANAVIEVTDNTNAALRITQLGTGNALLVEDSGNPDSTPFVIDASGRVIQGYTTAILTADDYVGTNRTAWGYQGNSTNSAGALFTSWNTTTTSGAGISLSKSRSATVGTQAIVSSGDSLGGIGFNGDDGTNFIVAASIIASVDGTPDTNDMPGRLVFSTTADGASSPTERMRIDSAGGVGIGGTSIAAGYTLSITRAMTGAATAYGVIEQGAIQTDVTTAVRYFSSFANGAASLTTGALSHFYAQSGSLGAGSAVTSQYGFVADSSLTGATNNYGFYSNIASGANRYNFYANGTAVNYFAGNVGIGTTAPGYTLQVSGSLGVTGTTVLGAIVNTGLGVSTGDATIELGTSRTGDGNAFIDFHSTASSDYELRVSRASGVNGNTTITSVGTGNFTLQQQGAGNMIFSTNAAERMRLDSSGNLGIGTSSPGAKLHVYNAAVGTQVRVDSGSTQSNFALYSQFDSSGTTRNWAIVNSKTAYGTLEFMVSATQGADPLAGTTAMTLNSSGNLGIGTTSPSASAILDAQSTTKGVRMPNMTTTQKNAIASPAAGLMVFDTTLAKLCVYTGAAWQTITSI